jgi:hypothetical protein
MRTNNGVARWQMDIKPEDLNRGNNLVSRQQGAHPNIIEREFRGELTIPLTGRGLPVISGSEGINIVTTKELPLAIRCTLTS